MPVRFGRIALVLLCVWAPATGLAAPAHVAVLPLQDLSQGKNDVNLPFTRSLSESLIAAGNNLTSEETLISFLAHNRMRTAGVLETFQISRIRDELGAAFILLGTVTQAKDKRNPSLGVTLSLVRTSDVRIVWNYVGQVSTADARRLLAIGEPRSLADLQPLLVQEIVSRWPWGLIGQIQQTKPVAIESATLQPRRVRPGAEVHATVRLRSDWRPDAVPRAFIKTDEQLHAASVSAEGNVYEASWVAGDKDGLFPVSLVLEWPLYGRSETALLGSYVVDGTPPLIELDLKGVGVLGDTPVFRDRLLIYPRYLIRKPLSRWRLSVLDQEDNVVAFAEERGGKFPEEFFWSGQSSDLRRENAGVPDGMYQIVLEVWDEAGNPARATGKVALNRSAPEVKVAAATEASGRQVVVDLENKDKVPLAFWRLEMWSEQGKLLKTAEGLELPARIGVEPSAAKDGKIRSVVVVRDVLGATVRQEVADVFGVEKKPEPEVKPKEEKPAGASRKWVEEF